MSKYLSGKVRIFLCPTSTYYACSRGCNLQKLSSILNAMQSVFFFDVVTKRGISHTVNNFDDFRISGIRYIQTLRPSKHRPPAGPGEATKRVVIDSYYVGLDIFKQAKAFFTKATHRSLSACELLVSVGQEVVVPDIPSNNFYGAKQEDAYSIIGDAFGETANNYDDNTRYDNNNDKRLFGNVAHICLLRCNLLFPDNLSDSKKLSRSMVARYIVINICHFVSAEIFGKSLLREHDNCVADTSWSGVESEKLGYSNVAVCDDCTDLAQVYGVAHKYKNCCATGVRRP